MKHTLKVMHMQEFQNIKFVCRLLLIIMMRKRGRAHLLLILH